MRSRFTPHYNPYLPWIILMVCATGAGAAQMNTTCPAAPYVESASLKAGYRIASVRWDPLLRQRWAKLVSCAHPEQPAIAMLLSPINQTAAETERQYAAPTPVVRAGDSVRLWHSESNMRIEASGIAEESGITGSTVRVRLLHSGLDGQQQEQTFQGVVRGPRDVEMQR